MRASGSIVVVGPDGVIVCSPSDDEVEAHPTASRPAPRKLASREVVEVVEGSAC
jgi:hypothetical protein